MHIYLTMMIIISIPSQFKEISETEVPHINAHTNPNIYNIYHINRILIK